jgi:SMC interacting uncharacterized protein involved in chromosome segregation
MEDEELKHIVRELANKISNAKALNGGFDRLVEKVDTLQEDLQELKYDYKVNSVLARDRADVAKIDMQELKQDVTQIKQQMSDPNVGVIVRLNHTDNHVSHIEKIAGGTDLIDLQDSLRTFKAARKYMWALILATVASVGKVIFDLFIK